MRGGVTLADRLHAIERAWAMVDADPRGAAALGAESWQVLARAAERLPRNEGVALLERALAIPGAPAPLQATHARHLRDRGDVAGARAAFGGALLRARPDAALLLEAAALMPDAAPALAALCATLPMTDADAVVARLEALPGAAAAAAGTALFARGHRQGRLMAALERLPLDLPPQDRDTVALLALNHHMAAAPDAPDLLAAARAREAGAGWVPLDQLGAALRNAVQARQSFSFVRLGDGEARFLMWRRPALAPGTDADARSRAADHIWRNWFGTPLADADPTLLAEITEGLDRAAADADLLGIASAARLERDAQHGGLCLALARYAAGLAGGRRTEGLFTYPLEAADPHWSGILSGLDWLGVVSPHLGLAGRLAARLRIPAHGEWVVPGESRLTGDRCEAHLPDAFRRTMAALRPPPGGVVLVAAGLLGKLYAQRVKQAGGIALDIGALADAWMGINTRGSSLDAAMAHPL